LNIFSHYTTKLTNNSGSDITIGAFDIGQLSTQYKTAMIIGADYEMAQENITQSNIVEKRKTIGLSFNFENLDSKADVSDTYILIKPLLTYYKNSEENTLSLPAAIYCPSFTADEVWKMLKKD